jgi:hypothetical protein
MQIAFTIALALVSRIGFPCRGKIRHEAKG